MHKRHSSDTGALEKRKATGWKSDDATSVQALRNEDDPIGISREPIIPKTLSDEAKLYENYPATSVSRKRSGSIVEKKKRMELKFGYLESKKRASMEVRQIFINRNTTIKNGWLRFRNSFKKWIKLYCVVKPGLLILFRSSQVLKPHNWAGTVLLNSCQIIERPSKKMGFCFNLYHPLGSTFWAKKGPRGEVIFSIKSIGLPASSLIVRAEDDQNGRQWLEAIKVAKTADQFSWNKSGSGINETPDVIETPPISPLVVRDGQDTLTKKSDKNMISKVVVISDGCSSSSLRAECSSGALSSASASDAEEEIPSYNEDVQEDDNVDLFAQDAGDVLESSDFSSGLIFAVENSTEESSDIQDRKCRKNSFAQTQYEIENPKNPENERRGRASITQNLETIESLTISPNLQSSLQHLSKCFERSNILEMANRETKPFNRIITVLKFYLAGFYSAFEATPARNDSKLLEPILGELHRCYWENKGSKTFLIAQYLCNKAPATCFYVTNRRFGFVVSGSSIHNSQDARGNNSSLEIAFLERSETYNIDVSGTTWLDIFGLDKTKAQDTSSVFKICCMKTSYSISVRILCHPDNSSSNGVNKLKELADFRIQGKIRIANTVLAHISGDIGSDIYIADINNIVAEDPKILWTKADLCFSEVNSVYLPKRSEMLMNESTKIIDYLKTASREDENGKLLEEKVEEYTKNFTSNYDHLFQQCSANKNECQYKYKYRDFRPWDISNDITVYEKNGGCILTHSKIPMRPLAELLDGMFNDLNELSTNQKSLSHRLSRTNQNSSNSQQSQTGSMSNLTDVKDLQNSIAELTKEVKSVSDIFGGTHSQRQRVHFMMASTIIYTLLTFITLILSYFSYQLMLI